MTAYELRGVPASVATDGWWLSASAEPETGGPFRRTDGALGGRVPRAAALLLVLVLLADLLFYGQALGLSLALFALAIVAVVWVQARAQLRVGLGPCGLALLSVLPVVEYLQPLSVIILTLGTGFACVWLVLGNKVGLAALATGLARFAALFPIQTARDLYQGQRAICAGLSGHVSLAELRRAWALPVLAGLGFAMLLVAGNPILERWLSWDSEASFDLAPLLRRLGFWLIAAAVVWPFLPMSGLGKALRRPFARRAERAGPHRPAFWVNHGSVANSLALFNMLFAVQTVLDLIYLWGGAALPEGMTYAEYAHRGAYPLVATELLAGAFALILRPFVEARPVLRLLLLLWIGQNLLLVISSLYRLDLYVEAFGLTYLRVHAGI